MRNLSIYLFSFLLFSFEFTFSAVKVVPTASELYINPNTNSAPVGFSRLVFNVPSTVSLGRSGIKTLFGCGQRYPFELESNTFNVQNRIFVNAFTEIMKDASYNVVGDPNALFSDNNSNPEFLVAAMISEFEIDYCLYPEGGFGNAPILSANGDG